jgi:electron transfer flavoprotein alpha subunit
METILFVAHTEADGLLARPALEALGAALELAAALPGSSFIVGLYGAEVGPAADQIANCGAAKFLAVSGVEFAQPRYASDAAAVETLVRAAQAGIVISPGTSRIARVLPGVSHRLSGRVDTHVNAIQVEGGSVRVTRWFYRQRMVAEVARAQRPWLIALDAGCHAAYQEAPGQVAAEMIPVGLGGSHLRTTVTGVRSPSTSQQTIRPDAKLLFVAGAGWTKKQKDGQTYVKQAGEIILSFLDRSGASLGSSKSLVDISAEGEAVLDFMSHMNQVGQTGATPRHPKGLSTCCHGEEPHVVGWRFINQRRAINLDPNCGWARGKTDVLYVADAFEVMRKVNDLLADNKSAAANL